MYMKRELLRVGYVLARCNVHVPPKECIAHCLPAQRQLRTSAITVAMGDKTCNVKMWMIATVCVRLESAMRPYPNYFDTCYRPRNMGVMQSSTSVLPFPL